MPRSSSRILAGAVLGAAATANAHQPLAQRGLLGLGGAWAAGVLVSELPVQTLALQAPAVALAFRQGAHRTPSGQAGLALTAASWAGLMSLARSNARSTDVLDASLTEGLGAFYHEEAVSLDGVDSNATPTPAPGLVRSLRIRRRYSHDEEVAYAGAEDGPHLDVWRRDDIPPAAARPVLVHVHGGGWMLGDKRGQGHPLLAHMAELGWVCVSIGYPLSPRATWPDQIVAVKQAIAWVRAHVRDFGGDPGFVAITGGSAGGHLAALAALTAGDASLQPGFEPADTSVQAAALLYGVYDWTNAAGSYDLLLPWIERKVVKQTIDEAPAVYAAASPLSRVHAAAPPTFVLHGSNDTLVPVAGAQAFVAALRDRSCAPVAYAEFARTQHAFDVLSSVRSRACAVAVGRFLGAAHSRWTTAAPAIEVPRCSR